MCEPNSTDTSLPGAVAPRILIAENDEAMRAFLARSLRRLGYDVSEIGSRDELVRYLKTVASPSKSSAMPNLIISGITIPGKTAIDILVKFKEVVHDIPIVLITTLDDPGTHALALRLGAAGIFDKPFNIETLKKFLKEHLPPLPEPTSSSASSRSGLKSDSSSGPIIA